MGFRLGSGNPVRSAPATTDKPLLLNKGRFLEVSNRLDSLYLEKKNQTITIRGAIEIALMELCGASPASVTEKLEVERTRPMWGF